jgi:hypothetical protein
MAERTTLRRPASPGKTGYGVSKKHAEQVKEFNKNIVYVQGFRTTLAATGATPINIQLNSPGKMFLGISLIPATGVNADIFDCAITIVINSLNIILNAAALNANPGFTQGILYLKTPQPLTGNDTITATITKSSGAGTPIVYLNAFYEPQ